MKDYYYILGLKQDTSTEEIKKAYRKLSLKFHPDKNDGDEFFTERFKEIQEAYETLVDASERGVYDSLKNNATSAKQNKGGTNFSPEIEYFRSDKQSFEYDEEITFSWKAINADKVILKPFGAVQPIGQKTYKIREFKKEGLTFDLITENTNIGRQTKSSLTLTNKTYKDLYLFFKEKIRGEEENKRDEGQKASQERAQEASVTEKSSIKDDLSLKLPFWLDLLILFFLLGLGYMIYVNQR